jgi:hypothetical protein
VSNHTSCAEYSGQQETGYIAEDGSTGFSNENNIYINTNSNALQFGPSAGTITVTDYNDFYQSGGWQYNGNSYNTLASWQGASMSPDPHSIGGNPSLVSVSSCGAGTVTGCQLSSSSSPAHSAGINLYSTCNGQPNPGLGALCSDFAGNARAASGPWDMGAYTLSTTPRPLPPIGVTPALNVGP